MISPMTSEPAPDVLVVDDDEDIRVSLERGLRLSGFSVRTAAGGVQDAGSGRRAGAELHRS